MTSPNAPVAPMTFLLKLWLLALAGLFVPGIIADNWPSRSWVDEAAEAHQHSLSGNRWVHPWIAFPDNPDAGAWIACNSLEEAVALDERIDDGNPAGGRLILFQDGLVWIRE